MTQIDITGGRIGLNDAFTRMPFRFGVVTMEAAVSATLELDVSVDGRPARGYAADLLAYKWFDKRPEKSAADNVADLLAICQDALAKAVAAPVSDFFTFWRTLDAAVTDAALAAGHNRLMAGFGTSMIERALLDAMGRALEQSFFALVRGDALGLRPADIHPALEGLALADALPSRPLSRVALRHTVGLIDPIDADDLPQDQRRNDGLPETLRDYLLQDNIRYLKLKVAGDRAADLDRLRRIAALVAELGTAVDCTLDGNEQYKSLDDFAALAEAMRADPDVSKLHAATLFAEQPLERSVALAGPLDPQALNTIGLPLLIDEADDHTTAYAEAIALGYHGVSHKNCKGVTRSLLNAMLARHHSGATPGRYFQSAEDLTCLPVVSLNADLAVVAALGIGHVERNGHHYFDGLGHLPAAEIATARADHPALYEPHGSSARLATETGTLDLSSLQTPGMGFAPPDMDSRVSPDAWSFDRLLVRQSEKEQ